MNELQIMAAYERKIYNGQPVMTLKDIDRIHQRPEGTARRNFQQNRSYFIEGIDYYFITKSQLYENRTLDINSNFGGIVLTLTGYLMIVKSFKDELSWAIQRELVNGYFGNRKGMTFMGTPVMTLGDAARTLGRSARTMKDRVRRMAEDGRFTMADGLLLEGRSLARFKKDNGIRTSASAVWVITARGFEKLRQLEKIG